MLSDVDPNGGSKLKHDGFNQSSHHSRINPHWCGVLTVPFDKHQDHDDQLGSSVIEIHDGFLLILIRFE